MNILIYLLAGIGALVVLAGGGVVFLFGFASYLARAQLRRQARDKGLTLTQTQ